MEHKQVLPGLFWPSSGLLAPLGDADTKGGCGVNVTALTYLFESHDLFKSLSHGGTTDWGMHSDQQTWLRKLFSFTKAS